MPDEQFREVRSIREVEPRPREHCGKQMTRLRSVSTMGKVRTVFVCAKECGHQERDDEQ